MGKTCCCTGRKTPHSDHSFGKLGKGSFGPEQTPDDTVVEEDTAFPSQSILVHGLMNRRNL